MKENEAIRKVLRDNPELLTTLIKAYNEGRLKDTSTIEEDEEAIIVAGPDHGGIEGSKQTKCDCGAVVWLSPSSQELLIARGAAPTKVVCISCVVREG